MREVVLYVEFNNIVQDRISMNMRLYCYRYYSCIYGWCWSRIRKKKKKHKFSIPVLFKNEKLQQSSGPWVMMEYGKSRLHLENKLQKSSFTSLWFSFCCENWGCWDLVWVGWPSSISLSCHTSTGWIRNMILSLEDNPAQLVDPFLTIFDWSKNRNSYNCIFIIGV